MPVKLAFVDGSFSISLRAWDKSWTVKAKSLYNLTLQRKFDDFMKARFKEKYMNWKEQLAVRRADRALERQMPR
ncbi:MAG TPA: hypothetical protein VK541_23640 [Pedobacter sp.]|uniref:hypothetical protein n=1 Tax=Pedobacter sp. TaxID=1411316 RepID=UPI002CAFCA06|nr:hypothetical protein [Pedobacter sp.]HMI05502.1 hypothetical protein [Pedobacter sp.]